MLVNMAKMSVTRRLFNVTFRSFPASLSNLNFKRETKARLVKECGFVAAIA